MSTHPRSIRIAQGVRAFGAALIGLTVGVGGCIAFVLAWSVLAGALMLGPALFIWAALKLMGVAP